MQIVNRTCIQPWSKVVQEILSSIPYNKVVKYGFNKDITIVDFEQDYDQINIYFNVDRNEYFTAFTIDNNILYYKIYLLNNENNDLPCKTIILDGMLSEKID